MKKSNHGANLRRWREWRNINQEVLADKLGISQASLSGYERKEQIEPEMLKKISKALDIPVEAITEVEEGNSINIVSNTFDNGAITTMPYGYTQPIFNPIEKIVELYERLLQAEKDKVAMLQGGSTKD